MNFFKIIIFLLSFIFYTNLAQSDSHDKDQNIVEKAKEINQKVKADQAIKNANISSEVGKEEPLPLNDPFVGDGSLGGGNQVKLIAATDEDRKGLSVFNYKLIGIVEGGENMYASLIDQDGEILTLSLFEELSPGVRLIALDTKEVVFEREEEIAFKTLTNSNAFPRLVTSSLTHISNSSKMFLNKTVSKFSVAFSNFETNLSNDS